MTKWIITAVLVTTLKFLGISVNAQVEGLWEIRKVTVGDQTMTPLAKWTRINSNFIYQSGNGWLQNSEGNWSFDKSLIQFLPIEKDGIADEFGPFEVEIVKDHMSWTRIEDGDKGRQTGYWHMNGHRPVLTLINNNGDMSNMNWEVSFHKSEMIWIGASDSNRGIKLTFGRMSRFPVD